MRAIRVHAPGGPEVLSLDIVERPEPGPGEVQVAVKAAGVNHRDVWMRKGNFGGFPDPVILGSDAAGEVSKVGPGVTGFDVGERVVVNPGMSCGHCQACLSGHDNECIHFHLFDGAYAEHLVVPSNRLVKMPSGLTFAEAAAIGVPYITAEEALVRAGALPGQSIVVWGASGGLGLATVQLAKLRGLRVLAVTRHEVKADKLVREGALDTMVWDGREDLTDQVQRRLGGRGADIVLDSLGSRTFRQSLSMVVRGGTVVTVGATTGGQVDLELGLIFRRRLAVIGIYLGSSGILPRLLALFARGALKPAIDEMLPLEQAAEAHRRMEESQLFGKIILTP